MLELTDALLVSGGFRGVRGGGGGAGARTPHALVNRGAWGGLCKNDIYPNSNQLMLRNSVGYH